MDLTDFADALFGLSRVSCDFELKAANVGLIREVKEEIVPVPSYTLNFDQQKEAIASFEVDGWKARSGDIGNHHMASKLDGDKWAYKVVFVRFVNAPTD